MKSQTPTDLVKAIAEIAASLPVSRRVQLYDFAFFLASQPLPAEETLEAIAADEAEWEAQFAALDADKRAKLIASIENEISGKKLKPTQDEGGEFNKDK